MLIPGKSTRHQTTELIRHAMIFISYLTLVSFLILVLVKLKLEQCSNLCRIHTFCLFSVAEVLGRFAKVD